MLEREIEAVLYAPRERRDDLQRANQRLREARADATANGAIRYDKDKVICSPTDDMLNNKVARILDAEESVNEAEKGLKCAQHIRLMTCRSEQRAGSWRSVFLTVSTWDIST